MDSHVNDIANSAITSSSFTGGAITAATLASGTITAAKFATDAIASNALAASAISEITSGLALTSDVTSSTSTITSKLPAALDGSGFIKAQIKGMDTDSLSSAATSAAAVSKITSGLATSSNITSGTSTVTALLPAALVGGRMDSSVGVMAANSITSSAISVGGGTAIGNAVDTVLTGTHGSGSWAPGTTDDIITGVLEAIITDHSSVVGSLAEAVMIIRGMSLSNYVLDNATYDSQGLLTSSRVRIFPNASLAGTASLGGSGEGELATFNMTTTTSSPGRPLITKITKG